MSENRRFYAVVALEPLKRLLAGCAVGCADAIVIGYEGGSFVVDGKPVLTVRGGGAGLAVVRRCHLLEVCRWATIGAVLDVHQGYWLAMTEPYGPSKRFVQYGLDSSPG